MHPRIRNVRAAGFTLIEMLGVLGITGLIMAMVAASISRVIPVWRVRQAAVEVATGLRAARAKAILNRTVTKVPYDTSRGRWTLLARSGPERVVIASDGSMTAKLPYGVTFTDPTGSLDVTLKASSSEAQTAAFTSRGLLTSLNVPGYVYLGNASRGIYWRVGVNSIGMVTLQRWIGSAWQ